MSSLDAGKLQLFCFILERSEAVFHIDIAASETVSHLKDAILYKNRNTLPNVDSHQLKLYKACLYEHYPNLKTQLNNVRLSDGDLLEATTLLSSVLWEGDVHVIVQAPADDLKRKVAEEDDLERKHKRLHPALSMETAERRWNVNSVIRQRDISGCYYLDPGLQPATIECLTAMKNGQFVLLSGARASGKSTRLLCLQRKLGSMNCVPLYFSFEAIDYNGGADDFWISIGSALQRSFGDKSLPFPIVTRETFLYAFRATNWEQEVNLLIDEFSDLHSASDYIQNNFLRALRELRNNAEAYAIKSVVAAGNFSILRLKPSISPFNISDSIDNPYFTDEETRELFEEYAEDYKITIEDAVVGDIWARSNGHPGMVCLLGRTIHKNLPLLLNHSSTLSYTSWQRFPVQDLYREIASYPTFKALDESLMRPKAKVALGFFRSHFAGYIGDVELLDRQHETLADFLTEEGVLLRPDQTKPIYRIASPVLDGYIRTLILPNKFSRTPLITPPTQRKNDEATLNVLELLKESLKSFDKDTIRSAISRSYKIATVKVGGLSHTRVPRESAYDTELMGILANWLRVGHGWSVTGQWHLRNPSDKHKYTNIVLKKDQYTIVLDILATGDLAFVRSHIGKTLEYKTLLGADEAWVVHFTCQDDFKPTWESDLDEVNVVHFSHDKNFTSVWINARFKDSVGNYIQITDKFLTI